MTQLFTRCLVVLAAFAISSCSTGFQVAGCNVWSAGCLVDRLSSDAVDLEAGEPIIVARVSSSGNLAEPSSDGWSDVAEYTIGLDMAAAVHPSVELRQSGNERSLPVVIQTATDGETLFIRLRWKDRTENRSRSFENFEDGAAVQFALAGRNDTSIMMGDPEAPVNIWHWTAEKNAGNELAAGGFGSTTPLEPLTFAASGIHKGRRSGEWTVVFSRALNETGDYRAPLDLVAGIPAAFAVWQGSDGERDGLKRVSADWIVLKSSELQ